MGWWLTTILAVPNHVWLQLSSITSCARSVGAAGGIFKLSTKSLTYPPEILRLILNTKTFCSFWTHTMSCGGLCALRRKSWPTHPQRVDGLPFEVGAIGGEGFPLTNTSTYVVIQLFMYKWRWLYTKVNAFVAFTAGHSGFMRWRVGSHWGKGIGIAE